MFCTTECWNCEDKNCEHYISKQELYFENQQLKEDILFCLKSIKQEMNMSTDSRTRKEMQTCYEILNKVKENKK